MPHEQVDECDIETLIPKLAGTTWLNHYLESLPNLEAQKQMCRQVISMRCSTADISYTGMFDRGSLVRHVQNCYAYADWTSTLVEVNYVNENFLSVIHTEVRHRWIRKSISRIVGAIRHSMHRDRRDKVHLNVPPFNLGTTMIHTL